VFCVPPRNPAHLSPQTGAYLFAIGAASKAVATTATYPYQVIKSRIQQRFAGAPEYTGLLETAAKIFQREGAAGFYKGFAANLLRVAPQSAVTLLAYEYIKAGLDAAAAASATAGGGGGGDGDGAVSGGRRGDAGTLR
jgi:hypothetical protein